MTYYPTPKASENFIKEDYALTDIKYHNRMYMFLNAPIISTNMSFGLNNQASTVEITVAQDPDMGNTIDEPDDSYSNLFGTLENDENNTLGVAKLYGFSLPRESDIVDNNYFPLMALNWCDPGSNYEQYPTYFAGICTSFKKDTINISGRTITINISDPREILNGVHVLCNSLSMTAEIGVGSTSIGDNVIDAYGYHDLGMTSGKNEYGISWEKIKEAILAAQVKIYNIEFEFAFEDFIPRTNSMYLPSKEVVDKNKVFNNIPDWYRIDVQNIDLLSLVSKVANDAGADFYVKSRKIAEDKCLVTFVGIKHNLEDTTSSDIASWISSRYGDNLLSYGGGEELRNEPNSKVIIGDYKNKMYMATSPKKRFWVTSGVQIYDKTIEIPHSPDDSVDLDDYHELMDKLEEEELDNPGDGNVGNLYPFWGVYQKDGVQQPLREPFLDLGNFIESFQFRVPSERISLRNTLCSASGGIDDTDTFTFIKDDEQNSLRPYFSRGTYRDDMVDGVFLTIPLMQAALQGEEQFYMEMKFSKPDIARELGYGAINLSGLKDHPSMSLEKYITASRTFPEGWSKRKREYAERFGKYFYEETRKYAEEYLGRKFIVTLPRSAIMERIWDDLEVPTKEFAPEIEYGVTNRGFFDCEGSGFPSGIAYPYREYFDSLHDEVFERDLNNVNYALADNLDLFNPIILCKNYPSGSFGMYADGTKKVLFEDINSPCLTYCDTAVLISCEVEQLKGRPDMAILTLPFPTYLDFEEYRVSDLYNILRLLFDLGIYDEYGYDATRSLAKEIQKSARSSNSDIFHYEKPLVNLDYEMAFVPLVSKVMRYGPWYLTRSDGFVGKSEIVSDTSLAPWNFADKEVGLQSAAEDRLLQSYSPDYKLTAADFVVTGFPELYPLQKIGKNSYITSIRCNFGEDGITTNYVVSTYMKLPGTFGKSEFDDISKLKYREKEIEQKTMIPAIEGENWWENVYPWYYRHHGFNRSSFF
ncbi:MAG: hypothetical protein WC967_12220 [Balneolaceae bacterium]